MKVTIKYNPPSVIFCPVLWQMYLIFSLNFPKNPNKTKYTMQFLKRKLGLGWHNANEDDGLHWNFLTKVLGYKDVNMCGPITAQHVFRGWNLLICVLCCDWLIKNLNQSAGGGTNDQKTFARSLRDHLGKRGSPKGKVHRKKSKKK